MIFETIGISSIELLQLEGMARGPEAVARALDAAQTWIDQRLPALGAAASCCTDPIAAAAGG